MLNIENKIFVNHRILFYSTVIVLIYILLIAGRILYGHVWPTLPDGHPRCIDFGWMWLSGKLAASGDASQIFDYSAFSAAQGVLYGTQDTGPMGCPLLRFCYPPIFLIFTYPLGFMSYVSALATWIIATFLLYQAAVYAIIPRVTALVVASTPVFILTNISIGHTGFLSAALIGFSLVFMERRPWIAGIFLGLLTYKPHLGLLFPITLLASGNWRAISSAAVTTIILAILVTMAFGFEGWNSFIDGFADRTSGLAISGHEAGAQGYGFVLQSVFGLLHQSGASTWVSWCVHVVVSAIVTLGIAMLWAKPVSYNLKAAALCVGLLIVSPYSLLYDLCVLSIAVAFFVKDSLAHGFLPGEKIAIFMCWVLCFSWLLSIGPVLYAVLLSLIIRRIVVFHTMKSNIHAITALAS